MSRQGSTETSVIDPALVEQPDSLPDLDSITVGCAIRLYAAFEELLKSFAYAAHLNVSIWEFAVDHPSLRRLGIGNNDLRWLLAAGFVSCSIETTTATDPARKFKPSRRLGFSKQTCFVLTERGMKIARALPGGTENIPRETPAAESSPRLPESQLPSRSPKWDRQRQELLVGHLVVKRFRVPAPSQEVILAAFEEEGWPPRIDDPLPPRGDQCTKRRLQETIKSLNRNQRHPLLRFLGDGSGQGVIWDYCENANGFGDHGARQD